MVVFCFRLNTEESFCNSGFFFSSHVSDGGGGGGGGGAKSGMWSRIRYTVRQNPDGSGCIGTGAGGGLFQNNFRFTCCLGCSCLTILGPHACLAAHNATKPTFRAPRREASVTNIPIATELAAFFREVMAYNDEYGQLDSVSHTTVHM